MSIKFINPETILLKGTKIVTVKASKRSKAHKRKVKISDKSKINIEKIINEYEDSIKNGVIETCGIFNDSGEMIFSKDGNENTIPFTKSEDKKCKGMILTHNHPKGGSLSKGDIISTGTSKLKEIRCIAKTDNRRYFLKRKDGENFTRRFTFNVLYAKALKYDKIVYKENMKLVNSGEMSIYDVDKDHWDQVWKRVAKDVPQIEYGSY